MKIKVRRNEALVKGHVLRATRSVSLMGQFFQLFINRGSRNAVRAGNTFSIYRRGNFLRSRYTIKQRKKKWEREKIGTAIVIDVRRNTCVALVTRSFVEIQNGDEVETSLAD